MTQALLTGFLTGFSLILAIGAQNAFVLRQGLLKAHVLPLVLVCSLSDAVLIGFGVAGFGWIATVTPWFPRVMALAGALFLLVYGLMRAVSAWKGGHVLMAEGSGNSLARVVATGLALTWLNPHVYLDTLGLIGAISTRYAGWDLRAAFGTGAVISSFTFFFGLGYGARILAPIMRTARAWRLLDALIALVMWAIAAKLLLGLAN